MVASWAMADPFEQLRSGLAERYDLIRELGKGSAATVYLAQDRKLPRSVAIKVLLPDLSNSVSGERFLREIQIASRLSHPRILPLYDSGTVEGLLFYVMPYAEGESLRDCLAREEQMAIPDAVRIAVQVAGALGYAHSNGVIHRDIKPENIMLYGGEAVVADFGIARAISVAGTDQLTKTGMTVGTPAYMSPEQGAARKDLSGRADLYSLACVLYEMLAGHPPFVGATTQEILGRHALDPVPRLKAARSDVSPELENAILKGMEKQPKARFVGAAQFVEALTGETVTARPKGRGGALRKMIRTVRDLFTKGSY